jgi:hypothetical protein
MSDIRIPCEFWNRSQQECRVTALFNSEAGETLWPEASCRWEIVRNPTREVVCECRLRALAQGRAFTIAETCQIPVGDWAEKIRGKWPGNETDEEIEAALKELSCMTDHEHNTEATMSNYQPNEQTDRDESDRLTSMCHWWPEVQGLDVPMPRTEIIEVGDGTLQEWMYACMEGPAEVARGEAWLPQVQARAAAFGFPLFLRTDMCSGKHAWLRTCHVPDEASFVQHLFSLMEEIECQTVWGLPNRAVVLRELLTPYPGFLHFEQLPIGKERRYFIRNGTVECHHPYWPPKAFHSLDPMIAAMLADQNGETDDEVDLLTGYAEALASRLPGYWSVDFYCDAAGKWWFIDAALGAVSWHPEHDREVPA